jgi:spermidine/putrescine transport system permease protein
VTLPLIAPAILAALLLCFAISIDDFVVTYFNSGSSVTFPLFVWGTARVAMPPQIYVIGTAVFFVLSLLMLGSFLLERRRSEARAAG